LGVVSAVVAVASTILTGTTIAGTVGTAKRTAQGYTSTDGSAYITVTGLDFTPSKVYVQTAAMYDSRLSTTQYIRGGSWADLDANNYIVSGGFKLGTSLGLYNFYWTAVE